MTPAATERVWELNGAFLALELEGGARIEGFFLDWNQPEIIRLSSSDGSQDVPVSLIVRAAIGDEEITPLDLSAARERWLESLVTEDVTPSPVLVGGLSLLVPGSGHLVLGEPRVFAACFAVDSLLIASAVYSVRTEDFSALVPLAFADVLLRVFTSQDAISKASSRRRKAEITAFLLPGGGGVGIHCCASKTDVAVAGR